jgi:PPOX class probable F420-dependent enzyme
MRLSEAEARRRFAEGRVMRLATADAAGRPHVVPAVFAIRGDVIVSSVDAKPKRHENLKRLRNIAANEAVSAIVDHYEDDDWTRLWWARADGTARLVTGEERATPVEWLTAKYPPYRLTPPAGPVVKITVTRWSGWLSVG